MMPSWWASRHLPNRDGLRSRPSYKSYLSIWQIPPTPGRARGAAVSSCEVTGEKKTWEGERVGTSVPRRCHRFGGGGSRIASGGAEAYGAKGFSPHSSNTSERHVNAGSLLNQTFAWE